MKISEIDLVQFKNYRQTKFVFNDRFNCITGLNGIGKTNLLDAVHYLAFTKSASSSTDAQSIQHDESYFSVKAQLVSNQPLTIHCYFEVGKGKVFKVNGTPVEKFGEHSGSVPTVLASPGDQTLITEGSEVRRKFIDGTLAQIDSEFLNQLLRYQKVVKQRNHTLKQSGNHQSSSLHRLLDVYDDEIINLSSSISQKRTDILEILQPFFTDNYQAISSSKEQATIAHMTAVLDSEFPDRYRASRAKDILTHRTHYGAHRDDFSFQLNNYPLKKEGSQGQQKSYVLALKLAQYDLLYQETTLKPILLLDDLCDKLDEERIASILHLLKDDHRFGQIFITDTRGVRIKQVLKDYPLTNFIEITGS